MKRLHIETGAGPVSALLTGKGKGSILALGHGAGRDMEDPILEGAAAALAEADISCLRFNFPYRERGSKAPDREPVLRDAWQAAFATAAEHGSPAWVGGKSLGGRIASMEVADGLPAGGLVFLGYPLHPPGRPERIRNAHLPGIRVPMLFLQGTRDAFATPELLEQTLQMIGASATLHPIEGGDHSFRVRGKPKDDEGTGRMLGEIAARFILSQKKPRAR